MIFDDSNAAAGGDGSYSFADIYAVLGGTGVDILRVDSGTAFPVYRLLKNLQIGDKTTNSATTTLQDTNVCAIFDTGKVLKCRSTQTTNWNCIFGTKVGTGNKASARNGVSLYFTNTAGTNTCILRNKQQWYGVTAISTVSGGTQNLQFANNVSGNGSELIDCIFQGFGQVTFGGTAATPIDNIYNLDVSGSSGGTGSVLSSFFVSNAERLTFAVGPSSPGYLNSNAANISMKDCAVFGTPSQYDFRSGTSGLNWALVRPIYSGQVTKFDTSLPTSADTGAHEYWLYDVKCVDGVGTGVSGIPVRLTDSLGNVQVDATTDTNGRVSFGSGLTANAVIVMDHYASGGVYTQRHRGPFLCEVNLPSQTGYNNNYFSHRYYFDWPGAATVTTSSGSFEDVGDVISMQAPAGNPTLWDECQLD